MAHRPIHEDPTGEREAELRAERKRQALEVQTARRLGPGCKSFTFATYPAQAFRELSIELQGGVFDQLTFSELLELLIANWRRAPPELRWVLNYEFATKRGRPRKNSETT